MDTPDSLGSVASVARSRDRDIDGLITELKWSAADDGTTRVSYSFPVDGSVWSRDPVTGYDVPSSGYEPWDPSYRPLDAAQQEAARLALQSWGAPARLSLVEVADDAASAGVVRVALTDTPGAYAWAYLPEATAYAGDIWLGANEPTHDALDAGSFGFSTLIHEIGHALGLKHPHERGYTGVRLPAADDWLGMTQMSYKTYPGLDDAEASIYPTTPMMLDIKAIQYLYGVPQPDDADSLYRFRQGNDYYQTIWDGGGRDTLVWDASAQGALIDLRPGHWSQLGDPIRYSYDGFETIEYARPETVAIYRTVIIEDAVGGRGADTIIGNDARNLLWGRAGKDFLDGGALGDTLRGGVGDDSLQGGAGGDLLNGGPGRDTLGGGGGRDRFAFRHPLEPESGIDTILDFAPGADRIRLDNDIFTALGTQTATTSLRARNFSSDGTPGPTSYIVYAPSSGLLYYDADGSGPGTAIAFAVLGTTTHPTLTAADLQVLA